MDKCLESIYSVLQQPGRINYCYFFLVMKDPIRTEEVVLILFKILSLAFLAISILIIVYCLFHQINPEDELIEGNHLIEMARDMDIIIDNNGFQEE
jgi:hypothetical protein